MPLVIGKIPCAISGKTITTEEKVMGFPAFPCPPHDPAIVCQDACAFRDEFEKWEFRDNVIKRVKELWSLSYRLREAFTIVFEDDNYLFAKSEVEDKVRILFLQHVFVIDIPKAVWRKFCKEVSSGPDVVSISPYSNTTLVFDKGSERVEICLHAQEGWRDCIKLSWAEWSHFHSILTANEALFD